MSTRLFTTPRVLFLAALLTASAAPLVGCGGDDGGGAGGGGGASTTTTGETTTTTTTTTTTGGGGAIDCAGFCAKGNGAGCANQDPECEMKCQQIYDVFLPCQSEWVATVNCYAATEQSDWTCDANGSPQVQNDLCKSEYEAFKACDDAN